MGLRGLEPPTSRLSGVRSNHLSYKPMLVSGDGRRFFVFRRPVVEMRRIELLTPCLQGRCSPSWATPPNLVDTSLLTNIKSLVIFVCHECPTYGWHHIRLCASLLRQLRCLSLRFASRFHTGTLIRCFTLLRNVSGGPKWTRTTDLTLIRRAL